MHLGREDPTDTFAANGLFGAVLSALADEFVADSPSGANLSASADTFTADRLFVADLSVPEYGSLARSRAWQSG